MIMMRWWEGGIQWLEIVKEVYFGVLKSRDVPT